MEDGRWKMEATAANPLLFPIPFQKMEAFSHTWFRWKIEDGSI
jgi:hypothetical protein